MCDILSWHRATIGQQTHCPRYEGRGSLRIAEFGLRIASRSAPIRNPQSAFRNLRATQAPRRPIKPSLPMPGFPVAHGSDSEVEFIDIPSVMCDNSIGLALPSPNDAVAAEGSRVRVSRATRADSRCLAAVTAFHERALCLPRSGWEAEGEFGSSAVCAAEPSPRQGWAVGGSPARRRTNQGRVKDSNAGPASARGMGVPARSSCRLMMGGSRERHNGTS